MHRRHEIFALYAHELGSLAGISFMPDSLSGKGNRWLSVMLVDEKKFGASRETIRLALEAENIESRPIWKPMHLQPVFKDVKMVGGKVSETLFRDGLCLPSGSAMSDADVLRVCEVVRSCAH